MKRLSVKGSVSERLQGGAGTAYDEDRERLLCKVNSNQDQMPGGQYIHSSMIFWPRIVVFAHWKNWDCLELVDGNSVASSDSFQPSKRSISHGREFA